LAYHSAFIIKKFGPQKKLVGILPLLLPLNYFVSNLKRGGSLLGLNSFFFIKKE
jgi:hypothetical protein